MRIVAAYAFRYEPDWLIDQLHENLAWVDGIVSWDTSTHPATWVPRVERIAELRRRAVKARADWILHVDPDERFQDGAEPILRGAADRSHGRWAVRLYELWTPTEARVDGVWGNRWRRRFYRPGHETDRVRRLDVDLYHLKMIEPANRAERRRVHTEANTWDNRSLGFDYMTDEEGLMLAPIRHPYTPGYQPWSFQVP